MWDCILKMMRNFHQRSWFLIKSNWGGFMRYKFMRFPQGKTKAVTLSYDDGVSEDKQLLEILRSNGLKCTCNINSSLYGKYRRMLKEESLAVYSNCDIEVASHGYEHLSLASVDSVVAVNEVLQDRKELENTY